MNTIKVIKLSDIIDAQPILNVGCVGHVAHGKSTLVYDLTGIKTVKHSAEIERNITINLGYANLRIYYNLETKEFINSNIKLNDQNLVLYRHISFVDCPGHQAFMATMMSGSEIFNVALMLIAMNDTIPQAQTLAHSEILSHTDISNIAIILNKIDLITDEKMVNDKIIELDNFIKTNSKLQNKPIIPISAQKKININKIINFLAQIPSTNIAETINKPFRMNILRSFNINKIGVECNDLTGGVIGGSIKSGYISVGDWIMIKPGIVQFNKNKWSVRPIFAQIESIQSDSSSLQTAYPGGLIALRLNCDPSLCRNNKLLGNNIYKLYKKDPNFEYSDLQYDKLSEISEATKGTDIGCSLILKINFLKNQKNYSSIDEIYLLINSLPIKAQVISKESNTLYHIETEKPIAIDQSIISILNKTSIGIELFATGQIIKINKEILIKLPSEIQELIDNIPKSFDLIKLDETKLDNITEIDNIANSDGLKQEIIKHINPKVVFKLTLPQLDFQVEQTRYIWVNAKKIISKFDLTINKDLKVNIDDSNIKWQCFGEMIINFFNYEYSSDNGLADLIDNRIIIHIKRSIKNKPQHVITKFIKEYYNCSNCNSISCRIGKILSKYYSICVICNKRKHLINEWIR